MKKVEIDGKFYRIRKGKLVEIPKEWVNKITTKQTKKKRRDERILKRCARKRRLKRMQKEFEEG